MRRTAVYLAQKIENRSTAVAERKIYGRNRSTAQHKRCQPFSHDIFAGQCRAPAEVVPLRDTILKSQLKKCNMLTTLPAQIELCRLNDIEDFFNFNIENIDCNY